MPNPRPRKYPKVSTENLIRSSRADFSVPTPLNQAIGRRFSEQEQADRKAADMKMSPLDRLKARLEAGAVIGSGIFESVQQLPKLLQGEDSYNEAIAKRMYEPRSNPEKSYEYVGDVADFLEKLETEYKIPQLLPQLMAYQPLMSTANQQVKKAVDRGATKAGMAVERSLEKPVTDIMNRGGVGADLLGSFNTDPSRIVKSGGGNWLRQGLDEQRLLGDAGNGRALQGWNRQPPEHQARFPERQLGAVADDTVTDWANKNMRKYMANQMGTDKDPVRLLAEQDISHFGMRPDEFGEYPYIKPSDQTKKLRRQHTERTGEESPVGESSLAAYWENLSDNAIKATTVGDIKNAPNASYSLKAKEDIAPYVDKVSPETPIYNIDNESRGTQSVREQLGFNRLLGVMRDDIAAGRISPEEVAKWDMEQAVRHVDKRDKAIYKAEAEEADRLAKEFARFFPTLKEYPDNSRWIELKVPDLNSLPKEERLQLIDKLKKEAIEKDIDPEQYVIDYPRMKLEEALAHEGEKMGHCVGSYCEDVISGKSRVISYRDANGDAHVTLEVTPPEAGRYPINEQEFKALPSKQKIEYQNAVRQWRQRNPDVQELEDRHINQALEQAGFQPRPDEIMQIKGKGDAAPVDRYKPYVQDFQRMTNYPIEGDFANSGFIKQDGKYMTQAEYDDYLLNELKPPPEPPIEGMKRGGAVHISNNPDTMRMELQNQRYAGGGMVRGLKALKGAMRNPEALVPSARGATKFAEPAPKTMSVIKDKGGNWLGGNIAGGVDKRLKSLKTPTIAGETPAQRIARHEKLLNDYSLNQDQIDRVRYQLEQTKGEAAIDKWIESNVGNYVKKEMGTPEDPVRLMLEKRAQEIEAQFQVDMNRVWRTRAKAEAETDPNKRANLMRRAEQQGSEAKINRDFEMSHSTHLPPEEQGWGNLSEEATQELKEKRQKAGFDPKGVARSEPAKQWENISDEAIDVIRAGDIQKQQAMQEQSKQANLAYDKLFNEIDEKYSVELRKKLEEAGIAFDDQNFMNVIKSTPITDKADFLGLGDEFKKLRQESFNADRMFSSGLQEIGEENPFVSKVDPETKLYQAYLGDLGIDHVVDVIRQDVAAGRIRPDQLNKLSMDQAIKRTAEYNKELIQKMNSERAAAREGLPIYKEYPEGYRWVELNKPGSFNAESEAMGHSVKGYEPPKGHPDWTENSGDYGSLSYGHGGWEGIKSGRAKVYSLIDSKGSPHVTVEVGKPQVRTEPDEMQKIYDQAVQEANERGLNSNEEFNAFYFDRVKQLQNDLIDRKQANASNVITQIKGKGNQKPVEDYIPFVQDFVRSGKWSDVNDMHHTDLHKLGSEYLTSSEAEAKYKPKIQEALNFLETHPSLEQQRIAQKAAEEFRGDVFDPEYDRLNTAAGRPITEGVPYTIRELRALLQNPEDWVNRGETIYTPISTALDRINDAKQELKIFDEPPAEGMKAGGKVHLSNNPDAMQMELNNKKFAMGGAVGENDVGSPSPQNSASPVPSFQAGGLVALKQALSGGKKAAKSAKSAKAAEAAYAPGVHYADPLQPPTMRMSEALGITGSEGKTLHLTEADRSRVFGPNRGGVGFSALQHYSEPHREAKTVWGFGDANTTKKKINQNKDPEKSVWTTFAGSPTQHKSNTVVIKDAIQNLQIANEVGAIHPAQIDLINKRLRETVVKKTGKPLFPSDFDITDPQAFEFAKTFDRRAAIGDVLLGTGVKGPMTRLEFKKANPDVKWSDSADMQRLLDRETDPILREAATNDVGPHLFVLDNGKIERPDLNIAFPHQVTGTDLGVRYELAPLEVAVPDWMKQYKGRVDKSGNPSPVGYYDLARNQPQQFIDEKYLTNLQKSGNKAGGAVKAKNKYRDGGAVSALMKHAETAGQSARMNNQRM